MPAVKKVLISPATRRKKIESITRAMIGKKLSIEEGLVRTQVASFGAKTVRQAMRMVETEHRTHGKLKKGTPEYYHAVYQMVLLLERHRHPIIDKLRD